MDCRKCKVDCERYSLACRCCGFTTVYCRDSIHEMIGGCHQVLEGLCQKLQGGKQVLLGGKQVLLGGKQVLCCVLGC